MKITKIEDKINKEFQPITVQIVIETQEELDALKENEKHMLSEHYVASGVSEDSASELLYLVDMIHFAAREE